MIECRWPRGCFQWAASDEGVCYFHRKLAEGLFLPLDRRRGILLSQVLSDEQVEIARLLELLGAEPSRIKLALARAI